MDNYSLFLKRIIDLKKILYTYNGLNLCQTLFVAEDLAAQFQNDLFNFIVFISPWYPSQAGIDLVNEAMQTEITSEQMKYCHANMTMNNEYESFVDAQFNNISNTIIDIFEIEKHLIETRVIKQYYAVLLAEEIFRLLGAGYLTACFDDCDMEEKRSNATCYAHYMHNINEFLFDNQVYSEEVYRTKRKKIGDISLELL